MGMWAPDGGAFREIKSKHFRDAMLAKFWWTIAYMAVFVFGLQAILLAVPERG